MIDGSGGNFWRTRQMRFSRPDLLRRVLEINTISTAELLCAQIDAGCQAVMIFDSWGGLLGGDEYEDFSLSYIRHVVSLVKEKSDAPIIVFGRRCGLMLPALAACGCDAVGVDWQTSLRMARRMIGGKVAIQGNLEPAALLGTPDIAAAAAARVLADYGDSSGHIFNLGHGVDKSTPPECVTAVVETVRANRSH
jgi:uroporphyrinogen decarboxylase